jgi:hypothetical protein
MYGMKFFDLDFFFVEILVQKKSKKIPKKKQKNGSKLIVLGRLWDRSGDVAGPFWDRLGAF